MENNEEKVKKFLMQQLYPFIINEVRNTNLKNKVIELVRRYKDRSDVECIYLTLPYDSSDCNVTLTIVFNSLLIDLDELHYIRKINAETPQVEYDYNFRIEIAYRYDYGVENTFVCRSNKFAELYNSKILYDKDGSYTEMSARKGKSWHIEKRPKAFDIDFEPDDFGSNQFDKK